jgi:hypothetical protein
VLQKDFFDFKNQSLASENGIANRTRKHGVGMILPWHPERPQISSGYGIIVVGLHIH